MEVEIKIVEHNSEGYKGTLEIRQKFLRLPLGLNIYDEDLECEKNQIHFAAYSKQTNKILGVVVMKKLGKICKLRQMVVDQDFRNKKVGSKLVESFENYAKSNGFENIELHARKVALNFYVKLGYEIYSEEFLEVNIPHFAMKKNLN